MAATNRHTHRHFLFYPRGIYLMEWWVKIWIKQNMSWFTSFERSLQRIK